MDFSRKSHSLTITTIEPSCCFHQKGCKYKWILLLLLQISQEAVWSPQPEKMQSKQKIPFHFYFCFRSRFWNERLFSCKIQNGKQEGKQTLLLKSCSEEWDPNNAATKAKKNPNLQQRYSQRRRRSSQSHTHLLTKIAAAGGFSPKQAILPQRQQLPWNWLFLLSNPPSP